MKKILVIGAGGQVGSVLTGELQTRYGFENVIASDVRPLSGFGGNFIGLDATDFEGLKRVVTDHGINEIYHLAAILSASGEKFPLDTWDINMKTFFNVLEVSRLHGVSKVFYPSSIAVFGQNAPKVDTPQSAPLCPTTVYGISKVAGENWASYYHQKYGLDIRSLRYPGIIGYQSPPGGGTTDYAVDIFHKAVQNKPYECFLEPSTMLPMIYMDDAIRATIELMEAPAASITVRTSYNLAGMSFSPAQLAASIKGHCPGFEISYTPDFRQEIADSWPMSIDDSVARKGWGWQPAYNLDAMTDIMASQLKLKYENHYSVV
ncbi:MAG: NAD-dependent epimerase/dehydratase family protein [Cyclobacteriaceae bacterium]